VTFHNQGANYPDALLLDAVLKALFDHIADHPAFYFDQGSDDEMEAERKRLRRRGLRQGCWFRRRYEGLRVPDAPTSQGENMRVLPTSHARVPAEQISSPPARRKRLYEDDPLEGHLKGVVGDLFAKAVADLDHPEELRELGMALVLDRPLGVLRDPFEPDLTPLLSYEAFSRGIAGRRLRALGELGWLDAGRAERLVDVLRSMRVSGVPLAIIPALNRPVPVSLDDVRRVAEDFVLLRTTHSSAERFFELFDFGALLDPASVAGKVVIVRDPAGLAIYDAGGRKQMTFSIRVALGYGCRAGVEFPAGGLELIDRE
jgi:hypothetical protein